MRLLFLMQGRKIEDHPGFHDAFLKLKKDGALSFYDVIPYFGFAEAHGWAAFYEEVVRRAKENEVTAVFFQNFHSPATPSPAKCINNLKALDTNLVIIVSAADAFSVNPFDKHFFSKSFRVASNLADMTFMTSMGRCAERLAGLGSHNIVLLPHAVCQARFSLKNCLNDLKTPAEYDVGFVGSKLNCRNPRNMMLRNYSIQREKLIKLLYKRYGDRFAVYGRGWDGRPYFKGVFPFDEQSILGQKVRIIFGGYPGSLERYYASDRPFLQGVSHGIFVDWYVSGVDRILRDGDHWHLCKDSTSLIMIIDMLLEADPAILQAQTEQRIQYLFSRHTQYHRMKLVLETTRRYREAHLNNKTAPRPLLDYFLDEVDIKEESKYAICAWHG